jgi:hypothetical protein
MISKKIAALGILIVFLSACTEILPPMPHDAVEMDADLEITALDERTGDVSVEYTLTLKNISEESLEKVILKEFELPPGVAMEKQQFVVENMEPGKERSLVFTVIVKGWGKNPRDETWDVDFAIRIEKGGAHTEQEGFYYQVHLYPA